MFDITRTVLNNLNQGKYIKNINRVSKKATMVGNKLNLSSINKAELEELNELQTSIRTSNLNVFVSNYFILKGKRFLIITLPALISALTIGSFILPTSYYKNKKLDKYTVETVHLDEKLGEFVSSEEVYYDWLGRTIEGENIKISSTKHSSLEYRITDGINSIAATFSISNDGKLVCQSVDDGIFIDLTKYDSSDYKELESKFTDLYDEIVSFLSDTGYLTKSGKDLLNKLVESEKRQTIIDIITYTKISEDNVVSLKVSRWGIRIILCIVCIIYAFLLYYYLLFNSLGVDNKLSNNDGELDVNQCGDYESLFFGAMRYREAFLAAEITRINRIYDLASRNLEQPMKIMTKYEKKIVLNSQKTN